MQIKLSFCIGCKIKSEVISKTSKKSIQSRKKEKTVDEAKIVVEQDVPGYRKIICPEIANYFNIRYMLLPTLEEYIIECMYFDDVAKIYTPDNDIIIKTRINDNIIWICFTIIHLIHLNLDEYLNLMTFNIEIKLTEGALSERVKTDSVRSFYFAENVQNTEFIEIYDYVNETDTAVDNICKHVIDDLLNLICSCVDKNFFLSKLNAISDIMHKKAINKLMENIMTNKFIIPTSAIDIIQIQDPDLNTKQKKITKEKKGKPGGPLIVLIKGNEFFIDEFLRKEICNSTAKGNICYLGLACTTRYQLNTYEKCVLNPLVVKLYSIKNLPLNLLQNEGCDTIYATYKIPSHPKTITNGYSIKNAINNTLKLNDFRLFPTDRIESINFIEYFQSQSLDIDFYGLRKVNNTNSHLFGEDINDINLSKKLTPKEAALILANANNKAMHIPLFRLKIKLNELFKQVSDMNYIKDNKNMKKRPSNVQKYKILLKAPLDILAEDCVNFIEPEYEKNQSQTNRNLCVRILQNKDLLNYNIKVEYRVKIYSNLNTRFYHALTSNAPIYHRILIKLDADNLDISKWIVTRIIMWNYVVHDLKKDGLSGFIAITDKYTLLFVEGLHNSYINTIWSMIYDKKINNSIILYDSKLLFTKRIYIDETEDFFDKPKIFFTLRTSACYTKVVNYTGFFTTPNTCEKIIRKIDILSNATSMEEISQNDLLPPLSMMKSFKTGNSLCDVNLLFKEESNTEILYEKTSVIMSTSTIGTINSNCCRAITSKTFLHELPSRIMLKDGKETDVENKHHHNEHVHINLPPSIIGNKNNNID